MITGYEVFEMIKKEYPTIEEQVDFTNELIDTIESNSKKLVRELEYEKDTEAVSLGICPCCTSELLSYTHKEYRGECHGFDSYEDMTIIECSNSSCGYILE